MKLARWIYLVAGIYGVLILVPGFFLERQADPSGNLLAHPEFYYGFYGAALVWQFAFFVIAGDPVRFRPLMPVTFLEKLAFLVPSLALYATGRLPLSGPFYGALMDGVLCVLFIFAWTQTPRRT